MTTAWTGVKGLPCHSAGYLADWTHQVPNFACKGADSSRMAPARLASQSRLTLIAKMRMYSFMSINSKTDRGRSIAHLRDALLAVQKQLSLQQLIAMLTIGTEPGLSVNELAERMRIPQQSASRHIAVLTGRYQNDPSETPLDVLVVQQISPSDPRSRALHLTLAGETLIADVVSLATGRVERDDNVSS